MLLRSKGTTEVIFADDLNEVSRYLASAPKRWHQNVSKTNPADRSWDLGVGYAGAWELARTGWSQGAADLTTAVNAIEPDAALPELRYDFGGERVDVPRYLGGSPDCMVRSGARNRQRPVVHLIINGAVSAAVGAKAIAAYGAALVAVVDAIENGGRRVEIDMVYAFAGLKGNRALVGWKVKAAEDHCDMAAIAFSIAHPAAFRRIGFALVERTPAHFDTYGYGQCGKVREDELALMDMEGAFILPGVGESAVSIDPKQMVPRAIRQINEAAGEEIVSAAE